MTQDKQASELDILLPTRDIEIAGCAITVHELTFSEQLQHNHLLKPIAEKFDTINLEDDANATNIIYDALSLEYDNVIKLLAICTKQPIDWVKSLKPDEGELLMIYWWSVNSGFFIRRQLRKSQAMALAAVEKVKAMAGETFSPSLSEQATTGETSSTNTPSDK